jgi:aerobic C4-dicarboxylate transport protein
LHRSLFVQIVAASLLGAVIGVFAPQHAQSLKILSDAFLRLISMIVSPLVSCVVVQGIAGAGDLRSAGRVGLAALVYFEAMTTLALIFGVLVALLCHPGAGLHVDPASLSSSALAGNGERAASLVRGGIGAFLLGLIPASPVAALAGNDVLQVLVFALLFGAGLSLAGAPAAPVARLIDALASVLFRIMGLIVRVAPLGVLGAIAYTVGRYGLASLDQLAALVIVYFAAVALFVAVALGAVMRLCGLSLLRLIAYLRTELLVVLATTSSDAVLPQLMDKLTALGIRREVVGLVIPAGYSFNLDALSIYLGLAVLFIAQATGTPLHWSQLALVLGTALLTSKGAHGIPGVAIVILAATLAAVPSVPAIGLVLVVSVDWFIGIARALGNALGNCVATIAVASWGHDIDLTRARDVLGGRPWRRGGEGA